MKEKIYTSNGNIMYLYRVMKKYTDANHPLKTSDIIKLIKEEYGEEISDRTIRRNFKVLESKFNIFIGGENGYYYLDYEDNDLDSSEVRCLVDMVNYSKFLEEKLAKELTDKLVGLLNENEKKEFDGYEKYMKGAKTTNKELFLNIQIIAEAIVNKNNIKFDYYKYNLKKQIELRKSFDIFPVKIVCDIGQYYLIAADQDKKLFYFRIDRIKNLEMAKKNKINISKKQVDDFVDSTVGMFGGEKETVKAIINNHAIDEIIELFGKEVKISQYDKENFLFETEANLEGFKHWGLRHLEDAKIIYPKKLTNEIIQILNSSIDKYNK